jgi:hypothetical protein
MPPAGEKETKEQNKDLLQYVAVASPLDAPVAPPAGKKTAADAQPAPLVLTGMVCPAGLYDAASHSCDWDGGGGGGGGDDDKRALAREQEAPRECPLCAYIKGGGCKEAFLPWKACIDATVDWEQAAEAAAALAAKEGRPPPPVEESPSCMGSLFDPVLACMVATETNRAYYSSFIADFSYLFPKEAGKGERAAGE